MKTMCKELKLNKDKLKIDFLWEDNLLLKKNIMINNIIIIIFIQIKDMIPLDIYLNENISC